MRKPIIMSLLSLLILSFISLSAREYTIIPYDNLWNLSKGFYQSGFEWQRIWRANPYIVNPDLIYPGDVLLIPGIGEVTLNQDGTYQVRGITFDDRVASLFTHKVPDTAIAIPKKVDNYVDKKIKEYLFSEAAVYTIPYIYKGENAKGLVEPGVASIDDSRRTSYTQFSTIKISTDTDTPLAAGKYVLAEPVEYIELNDEIVNIIKPVGFCELRGNDSVFVSKSWGIISDSARVVPYTDIAVKGGVIFKESATPVDVNLLSRVNKEVIYHQYEMLILEGGRNRGLSVGDLLDGYMSKTRRSDGKKVDMQVMVVKVQAETATAIVTQVLDIVKDAPLLFRRSTRLVVEPLKE